MFLLIFSMLCCWFYEETNSHSLSFSIFLVLHVLAPSPSLLFGAPFFALVVSHFIFVTVFRCPSLFFSSLISLFSPPSKSQLFLLSATPFLSSSQSFFVVVLIIFLFLLLLVPVDVLSFPSLSALWSCLFYFYSRCLFFPQSCCAPFSATPHHHHAALLFTLCSLAFLCYPPSFAFRQLSSALLSSSSPFRTFLKMIRTGEKQERKKGRKEEERKREKEKDR